MERDTTRRQRLKDRLYVAFWSTCDKKVEIREGHIDEILDKVKDLFSWRWNTRIVGAFIEGVYDEENRVSGRVE